MLKPPTQASLDTAPEHALIAAMFRCAIADAKSTASASPHDLYRRTDARRWFLNRAAVQTWLDLLGLPETTYMALLREVGLDGAVTDARHPETPEAQDPS